MESEKIEQYTPQELASKVFNLEISPELLKEIMVPAKSYMEEFAGALKTEIISNKEFNNATISSLEKITDSLANIISNQGGSIDPIILNRIIELINEIVKTIKDINFEAQKKADENKKFIIKVGAAVATIAVLIFTGGRINLTDKMK
ncbi:MAG: hypothetical protein RR202_10320 [Bacteroidales bacterium]